MGTRPILHLNPAPTWRGRLVAPVRKVLLKLMTGMFGRVTQAHDETVGSLGALSARLDQTQLRVDRLTEETAAANALAWDQVALARRLTQIEARLAEIESRREAAADHAPAA